MRMRRPMVHSPSAAVNACEAVAPEDRKSEDAHQPVQKKHRASSRQSAKIAMASFFRPGSFRLDLYPSWMSTKLPELYFATAPVRAAWQFQLHGS
jgi:16S rRNA C967 or C1407 C5-methylase (RsmB/RsmF family)